MIKHFITVCLVTLLTGLHSQSINISNGELFDGEPFMVVNSTNTSHIVIAWMGFDGLNLITMKLKISEDGGLTWSAPITLPHINTGYTCADPSMGYDNAGNLFIGYIDYNPFGTSGKAIVRKSTDGGYTWGDPVEVMDVFSDPGEAAVDRPWMVIDKSGTASDGNIYVTTKPAPWIPFPNRNYIIPSTDNGLSFNPWKYIDGPGGAIGDFIAAPMASPAVGIDGTFHCVYPSWDPAENLLPRFILASSEDAANTFTYQEVFEASGDFTNNDENAKIGYLLLASPVNTEHLMFVYILSTHGDMDILYRDTWNKGLSWSESIRVNDDPISNDVLQDLVWGDFDSDGDLILTWRDRRNAPDTGFATSSEIYGAILWKDALTFTSNFNVSGPAAGFDSVLYENGNDFMCVNLEQDTIYATWGDTRSGYLNIWFNKFAAGDAGNNSISLVAAENTTWININPNPAITFIQLESDCYTTYAIYDEQGKLSAYGGVSDKTILVENLPTGIYHLTLNGRECSSIGRFVKL